MSFTYLNLGLDTSDPGRCLGLRIPRYLNGRRCKDPGFVQWSTSGTGRCEEKGGYQVYLGTLYTYGVGCGGSGQIEGKGNPARNQDCLPGPIILVR